MNRIDAFVSQFHYAEHLQPILDALPEDRRGRMYAPRNVAHHIDGPCEVGHVPSPSDAPLLVGGYMDARFGRRPKVLVNHGAGQCYSSVESPSLAGGPGHEGIDLFINPSERVAALERARYGKPSVAVGCVKLDAWAKIPKPTNIRPVIGFTFHWDQRCRTVDGKDVPESGNAWQAWRDVVRDVAAQFPEWKILGHAHPRARELPAYWASIGVEFVPRAIDLLARVDCLVLDNSSLGFEFAALDRPTVWLRDPAWGNTDRHGPPRFDGHLPGPEIGWGPFTHTAATLVDAIRISMDRFVLARMHSPKIVYDGLVDGHASERAAAAVLKLADGGL